MVINYPWILSFLIFLAVVLSVFFIIPFFFGAPFQPTNEKKLKQMIRLAKIKKGDKAIDLGSGDGRIVIALAKAGAEAHGYEINPFLVLFSKWKIKRAGLSKKAFIHWKSFWDISFKDYNVVTFFQFGTIMHKLEIKMKKELKPKSRVVSYYWKFPEWKPSKKIGNIWLYKK